MTRPIESLACAIASDDPNDWNRMGEAQREYWRRIAVRVFVWSDRQKKAKAEAAAMLEGEPEAA